MERPSSNLAFVAALAFAIAAAVVVVQPCEAAQSSPQDFVRLHNAARAQVGVGPVSWDAKVAAYAQSYAAKRKRDCALVHSGGPYGENIYKSTSSTGGSASDVVGSWVAEKQWYHRSTNSCSAPRGKTCGHYTQVVWRKSTKIGCARVVCDGKRGVFVVCSYNPPGNVNGGPPY